MRLRQDVQHDLRGRRLDFLRRFDGRSDPGYACAAAVDDGVVAVPGGSWVRAGGWGRVSCGRRGVGWVEDWSEGRGGREEGWAFESGSGGGGSLVDGVFDLGEGGQAGEEGADVGVDVVVGGSGIFGGVDAGFQSPEAALLEDFFHAVHAGAVVHVGALGIEMGAERGPRGAVSSTVVVSEGADTSTTKSVVAVT